MELEDQIARARETFAQLTEHRETLGRVSSVLVETLRRGNKVLACGNGGSAAEAQHLVTELVGRYLADRQSLPALYLGGDASMLTCIANDYSFDEVFSRPLAALAVPGDLLFGFTTSGGSRNVVRALELAREKRITSVALLGKEGGAAKGLATFEVVIRSRETARIQEAHLFILHWLCEQLDAAFRTAG